jgi:hypothetical protein
MSSKPAVILLKDPLARKYKILLYALILMNNVFLVIMNHYNFPSPPGNIFFTNIVKQQRR